MAIGLDDDSWLRNFLASGAMMPKLAFFMSVLIDFNDAAAVPDDLEDHLEDGGDLLALDDEAELLFVVEDEDLVAVDTDFDVGMEECLREHPGLTELFFVMAFQFEDLGGDFADDPDAVSERDPLGDVFAAELFLVEIEETRRAEANNLVFEFEGVSPDELDAGRALVVGDLRLDALDIVDGFQLGEDTLEFLYTLALDIEE